jgi:hypothetical protein
MDDVARVVDGDDQRPRRARGDGDERGMDDVDAPKGRGPRQRRGADPVPGLVQGEAGEREPHGRGAKAEGSEDLRQLGPVVPGAERQHFIVRKEA